MIFYTSDLHFGHEACLHYDNRPFKTIEENDSQIISNWNKKVSQKDEVYILGDISWYSQDKTISILNSLNGKKHLIKGNHDRVSPELRKCFDTIAPYKEIKDSGHNVILCHFPIASFNRHFYGSIHLYGHVHNSHEENYFAHYAKMMNAIDIPFKVCNVGCMHWGYSPVSLDEIKLKIGG